MPVNELNVSMSKYELMGAMTSDNVLDVIQFLNVVHGIKLGSIAKVIGVSNVTLSKSLKRGYFFKDFDKDEARLATAVARIKSAY